MDRLPYLRVIVSVDEHIISFVLFISFLDNYESTRSGEEHVFFSKYLSHAMTIKCMMCAIHVHTNVVIMISLVALLSDIIVFDSVHFSFPLIFCNLLIRYSLLSISQQF